MNTIRHRLSHCLVLCLCLCLGGGGTALPVHAQPLPGNRVEDTRAEMLHHLQAQNVKKAARALRRALKHHPHQPDLLALRALIPASRGKDQVALKHLETAVDAGFSELDVLLDLPLLAPLRGAAEARGLVSRSLAQNNAPARLRTARVQDGRLPLDEENLIWNAERQRYLVATEWPPARSAAPLPDAAPRTKEHERRARAGLSRLILQGKAAGFNGLLYDNRDTGHSPLKPDAHGGVAQVDYSAALRRARLATGLADDILFDRPVVGNSSTAFKNSPRARSLVRDAMTRPGGAAQAWQNYVSNQIYVYPEHRDHDAVDLYPANWPYAVISQGSSYQDQPFVKALLWALAAMKPETRAFVEREHLVAPTLQMILRRAQTHIRSPEAYLTGPAHPTAFDQTALQYDRVINLAQSLRPEDIPPMPVMRVLSDDFVSAAGLMTLSERLFDTPGAVARIWRGPEWEKTMILAAQAAGAPDDSPAHFDWVLLRGDPERVRIEPLDPNGRRVRVTFNWHDRRLVQPHGERVTDRADIGLFVRGTTHHSAPAFLSVSFPTHQRRTYGEDAAGHMRLEAIDYSYSESPQGAGQDPLLHWSAEWRDHYHYDAGRLIGWTRHYQDGRPERRFLADGRAEDGREITYNLQSGARDLPEILEKM